MTLTPAKARVICGAVWVVFIGLTFINYSQNNFTKLFALGSVILLTHVLYAGYVLLIRLPQIKLLEASWFISIGLISLLTPRLLGDYRWLGASYGLMFVLAIALHHRILGQNISPTVNKLCAYKIKLEFGIFAYLGLQTGLIWRLPGSESLIIKLGLLTLVAANIIIIWHHRLYHDLL